MISVKKKQYGRTEMKIEFWTKSDYLYLAVPGAEHYYIYINSGEKFPIDNQTEITKFTYTSMVKKEEICD